MGCDKALRIYDLGKKKLLHKSANKRFGSWIQVDRKGGAARDLGSREGGEGGGVTSK